MAARNRAAVLSERELVAHAARALVEVDVLAGLLAMVIRSEAPVSPASKRLEAVVEQIPAKFAAIMGPLVAGATAAIGDRVRDRKTKRRAGSSAARRGIPANIKRFDAAVDAAVDAAIDAHARGKP